MSRKIEIMWVRRRQFPIGQGGFHAGTIGLGAVGGDAVNYVYDCGSINRSALRAAVQIYAATAAPIDALFISHLDDDHVSGLDQLLASVPVRAVYLPYLDEFLTLMQLLEADFEGAISGSLIELSLGPESWFGRRGVERVIRILPGNGEPPDRPPIAEGPDLKPETIKMIAWPSEPHLVRSGRPDIAAVLEMSPGSSLAILADGRWIDWILQPYVNPAPAANKIAFRRAVRKVLDLPAPRRLTAARISDALRDRTQRKSLKQCYENIVSGGAWRMHNRVSMSLYSGPSGRAPQRDWRYERVSDRYWSHSLSQRDDVGWLSTGDATLGTDAIRSAWQSFYRPVTSSVSTLVIPHHGSSHNFHPDLLDFPNLRLCIASAGDPSGYKHPSAAVVHEIESRGISFALVSQEAGSGLTETIESA